MRDLAGMGETAYRIGRIVRGDTQSKAYLRQMLVLLCILDGFGLRESTPDNAVSAANKPTYNRLVKSCAFTKIDGSGPSVGLPVGQMGNSEVGHLNLGAGRVVYQDITRIDKAIDDGDFFDNEVFTAAMERVAGEGKAVHLFGLVSDGCVHSSLNHLYALVKMAQMKGVKELYLHAFTDGRDTPPTSGQKYISEGTRQVQGDRTREDIDGRRPLLRHGSGSPLGADRQSVSRHHVWRGAAFPRRDRRA